LNYTLLSIIVLIYIIGLLAMRRTRHRLPAYLFSSFGLVAIVVLASKLGGWHEPVGGFQARLIVGLGNLIGMKFGVLDTASLVIPDPTGFSILRIEVECSTLIEATVFSGLLIFYPRFQPKERFLRLILGLAATFAINFIRLGIIIGMVTVLGKPSLPWAHAVIGRVVFFIGVVFLYWRMLTIPTLRVVVRDLEVSGRAVR
jgi:exosortase family protein XrtG